MWAKIWTWIKEWFGKKADKVKVDPVIKPKPETDCGCDLSKPLAVPLVPELGNSDTEVNTVLYNRWKEGVSDTCGGLPGDIRPLLIRPQGKTFGWKYVILDGAVKISICGEKMTVWCGTYKNQRLHIIGCSDHEAPNSGARPETLEDFIPMKSGVEVQQKHFIYFEVRGL